MLVACEIYGDAKMKNLIIGLVVAAAVVGCGKDDVEDTTTTDTSVTTTDDTSMTDTSVDTAATDETM
jgi:hypothetical protein